ncbi:TonB-dependent receptor [Pseudoduganella sp. LjRoot289]|uniref:TonB-dependent receptor domain-containing protein n=1 Tax=Pseudoduganella sp. LjRoot289 TaxID=3342314 RepID=UPI003ECC62DF
MTTHPPGRRPALRLQPIAALLASSSFAALIAVPAHAQQESPATAAPDALRLDTVVMTASPAGKSKMRSSVSVSDVESQQVADFGPRSEAEVLHLIPGVRAESSAGPGGNSNITVRGLPISSGGSKYVQLQEDGLPVVEFGDMNFANNDYFIRYDANVDRIQTVRGGSASTFASNAPGAVINFISKTGEEEGGTIGMTRGLNYKETRVDGDVGGKLSDHLRYHVGGYYRSGEGPRRTGYTALEGYQLKGNLTHDFNGGKGYVRLNFKLLDEKAPTYTSMPAFVSIAGNTVGGFSAIPGLDVSKDAVSSPFNSTVPVVGPGSTAISAASLGKGITMRSRAVGLELHNEFDHGFTLDEKFKLSRNASSFQTQFLNLNSLADILAGFGAGSSAVYANGPRAGQAVTQANLATGYMSQNAAINTLAPEMDHMANDISLSKKFSLGGSKLNARAGLYHARQDVVQQWAISERLTEVGRDGALIDVRNAAGTPLTSMGLTGYNNQWGGCCARDVDAHYKVNAPYLSLNMEAGDFDFDASLRHDRMRASGKYAVPVPLAGGLDVDGDGRIAGAERNVLVADVAHARPVAYAVGYTSHSLGANWRVSRDLSVFARTSKGGRAIADRLLYSSNIDPVTGTLAPGAQEAAVATVKQSELGAKLRGSAGWGKYGVFATVFHATVNEYDYDQTRTVGPKLNLIGYKADGLELESVLSAGNFSLNANAVYTKAKITRDLVGQASGASTVGGVPGGTPDWLYTIAPRYSAGAFTLGAVIVGQTAVWSNNGNNFKVKGRQLVNAFLNYELTPELSLGLNVSNLFNKITPSGGIDQGSLADVRRLGAVVGAGGVASFRPESPRTASVALRYRF